MNAIYDVVCSVVIGGIVLVMLVSFNGSIAEGAAGQTIRMSAQSNMTALEGILEFDLRKAGYRVDATPADSGVVYAGLTRITLKGDFNNDGTADLLRYYFDSTSVTGLPNTRTHMLHRVFNGFDQVINHAVTSCRFTYFDRYGTPLTADPVPSPSEIRAVRVALTVESTVPYRETSGPYVKLNPGVHWERTIRPRNLR